MSTSATISTKVSKISLICAFFVVCIHCKPDGILGGFTWWFCELFNKGICIIAVPFFFVVSGFFLAKHIHENCWWKREVVKRVRTLLIPYFSWGILNFLYAIPLILIANILANTSLLRNFPTTLSDFLHILGLNPFQYPYLIPLWFIRCLFLFVLVSPLIAWIVKKSKRISLIFLTLIFPLGLFRVIFQVEEGDILWCTVGTFSFLNLFYFSLGLHLALYPLQQNRPKYLMYLAGSFWLILLVSKGLSSLHTSSLSPYFGFLSIPAGLYFIWHIVTEKPWNRVLTQASFPIFILHMFFLSMIGLFIKNLIPNIEGRLSTCMISSIIAFYSSIFSSYLTHKYLPRMSHFLFGGR